MGLKKLSTSKFSNNSNLLFCQIVNKVFLRDDQKKTDSSQTNLDLMLVFNQFYFCNFNFRLFKLEFLLFLQGTTINQIGPNLS